MAFAQTPEPGTRLHRHCGETVSFELRLAQDAEGQAWLRTNLGRAAVKRNEIIAYVEYGRARLDRDWHDVPMERIAPCHYRLTLPLLEVGQFGAKAFWLSDPKTPPVWVAGDNVTLRVEPDAFAFHNTVYNAFVRQFLPRDDSRAQHAAQAADMEQDGFTVIPPSGRFRDFSKHLPFIVHTLGFRILQLLPVHPVPTSYGKMGPFGSPFAALDFMDVDSSMAEFDRSTTPLGQFCELVDQTHKVGARVFLDLPVNHTGWASWLQIHHPEWFVRGGGRIFESPGAWGVVWEDLSKLDYGEKKLWGYMAEVFLHWCRLGVDGFRCDAGYMVPFEVWEYLVAKVRDQFPSTIFFLEGLGGELKVMENLLSGAGLNWAYSELFQNYTRHEIESYLQFANRISTGAGLLVHFAETHDNDRLAAVSPRYAQMRTALAALTSQLGGFGISNGVEWFATEKIRVHEANDLNWGDEPNQVEWIRRLNQLLATHPCFTQMSTLEPVAMGNGRETVAFVRNMGGHKLLILANLDCEQGVQVRWSEDAFPVGDDSAYDLLSEQPIAVNRPDGLLGCELAPGQVLCLSRELSTLIPRQLETLPVWADGERDIRLQRWVMEAAAEFDRSDLFESEHCRPWSQKLAGDPVACLSEISGQAVSPVTHWSFPEDLRRVVPVPAGHFLYFRSSADFSVRLEHPQTRTTFTAERAVRRMDDTWFCMVRPPECKTGVTPAAVRFHSYGDPPERFTSEVVLLSEGPDVLVRLSQTMDGIVDEKLHGILSNRCGAMVQTRAAWGELESLYDALLAANPASGFPSNRWVHLRRIRAWVVYRGYSTEVNRACLRVFRQSSQHTLCWSFDVPCGLGRHVRLEIRLSLAQDGNWVRLCVSRPPDAQEEELPPDEGATLILRPDLEDREAHGFTLAKGGIETRWPRVISSRTDGFTFQPASDRSFRMGAKDSEFILQPEWLRGVEHPLEAERGLHATTDLFSPGYFQCVLHGGEAVEVDAQSTFGEEKGSANVQGHWPSPSQEGFPDRLPLDKALSKWIDAYVADRDGGVTLVAGFPWFLDWGRDSLIGVRGLIALGRMDEARGIINSFAALERDGTLPNMLHGVQSANRDTSDAPLWLFIACRDYMDRAGSDAILNQDCNGRTLRHILTAIAEAYLKGTSNGIRVDASSGLVFSPAHFSWMDTNHPAATPREGYPIEIQSLWQGALELLGQIDGDSRWGELKGKVKASITELYSKACVGYLSDCLHAPSGTGAGQAVPDDHLRPNQLLAVTLGAVRESSLCVRIVNACRELLVPGAVRSLADRDVRHELPVAHRGQLLNQSRRPYMGHYRGPEDFSRKPAYHNGTAWTWFYPVFCEALALVGGEAGAAEARCLLSATADLMNSGCLGHVPEILDGDAPHAQRGCGAQLWGATETCRVIARLKPGDML